MVVYLSDISQKKEEAITNHKENVSNKIDMLLPTICSTWFGKLSKFTVQQKRKNKQWYPCRGWQRMVYVWLQILRYCLIFN